MRVRTQITDNMFLSTKARDKEAQELSAHWVSENWVSENEIDYLLNMDTRLQYMSRAQNTIYTSRVSPSLCALRRLRLRRLHWVHTHEHTPRPTRTHPPTPRYTSNHPSSPRFRSVWFECVRGLLLSSSSSSSSLSSSSRCPRRRHGRCPRRRHGLLEVGVSDLALRARRLLEGSIRLRLGEAGDHAAPD